MKNFGCIRCDSTESSLLQIDPHNLGDRENAGNRPNTLPLFLRAPTALEYAFNVAGQIGKEIRPRATSLKSAFGDQSGKLRSALGFQFIQIQRSV